MKKYHIRKILDKPDLEKINEVLTDANQNNYWIDGLHSGGGSKETKNNLELSELNLSQFINNHIMQSLDRDKQFLDFTIPTSTHLNIVSKMVEGGYYNPHTDEWMNGDFSTTVFLNDPDEYDGGELCLYFGGDEEVKIKLEAGYGVTYSTGILHRVNKVKSGIRYVSVFWTKSLIKDEFIRYIYDEIGNIEALVDNIKKPIYHKDCYSASKDFSFCISNLKTQILRRYSSI